MIDKPYSEFTDEEWDELLLDHEVREFIRGELLDAEIELERRAKEIERLSNIIAELNAAVGKR